jgi:hypothetical protein
MSCRASLQECLTTLRTWQAQGVPRRWPGPSFRDVKLACRKHTVFTTYAIAQKLSRDQGDTLAVTPRTLHKRLKERGLLASTEASLRETLTVRRTLGGHRRAVLHVRKDVFIAGLSTHKEPDQPDQTPHQHPESGGTLVAQNVFVIS